MNVFVIEDDNWDNYAIMSKYISKNYLPDNTRIHHVYGKHLPHVSKIIFDNDFDIYRRNIDKDDPKKSFYEIIKNMKICIIFHNFIEYTTPSSFVIKVCEENKIPYIIISEHTRMCFLNGEIYEGKVKGALKKAAACEVFKKFIIVDDSEEFNNLNNISLKERKTLNEIKQVVASSYSKIETTRNNKSIILIDQIKTRY
tara:strand:- start:7801 stop:8397 length:597 start_codon:yes stop_codon:yes gene_type:complete